MSGISLAVLMFQVVVGTVTVSVSLSLQAGVVFSAAACMFVVGLHVVLLDLKKHSTKQSAKRPE